MKYLSYSILICLIFLQSCKDDCEQCLTPPRPFNFEIVDNTSLENLFENGTYQPEEIQVINTLNDSQVEFTYNADTKLIQINSIGWKTEVVNLRLSIAGNDIFDFYVDAERETEDCCSFTEYRELTIKKSAFKINSESGVYVILLE